MFYFYCPKCGYKDKVLRLPSGTVGNCRGGYGTPIHHYECPRCCNLDAGFMRYNADEEQKEQEKYFNSIIEIYQNIRGVNIK